MYLKCQVESIYCILKQQEKRLQEDSEVKVTFKLNQWS